MAVFIIGAKSAVNIGYGEAGVVFKTSGLVSKKVKILGVFPQESHGPITYPIAQIITSKNPAVEKFYAFLKTKEAKAAFSKYGFIPILK